MAWACIGVCLAPDIREGVRLCAGPQDLLRCAGDAWLEGASSSSDNDDGDEDYGARRRATGARASTRSGGRRRTGGGRSAAAAPRSRVKPWLPRAAERLLACAGRKAMRLSQLVALVGAFGLCCRVKQMFYWLCQVWGSQSTRSWAEGPRALLQKQCAGLDALTLA